MEQTIKTLFQAFMRYGAFFGALQVVGAALFYMSVNPETVGLGALTMLYVLFYVLPWVGGLLYFTFCYKRDELGCYISMPEILQFSAFVALFGGAIFVLFSLVLNLYIDKTFQLRLLNTLSVRVVAMLESAKSTQAEIDSIILQLNAIKEAAAQGVTILSAFMAILQYSFNGVLTMLVFGWFIRKVRPLFPENKPMESGDNDSVKY